MTEAITSSKFLNSLTLAGWGNREQGGGAAKPGAGCNSKAVQEQSLQQGNSLSGHWPSFKTQSKTLEYYITDAYPQITPLIHRCPRKSACT